MTWRSWHLTVQAAKCMSMRFYAGITLPTLFDYISPRYVIYVSRHLSPCLIQIRAKD